MWGSDLHNSGRTSLVLLFSSLWVTHLVGMEFDFIIIVPFLPSRCGFFFIFGHGVSFFGVFQHPPVNGCSTASGDFGALTEEDCTSFYSAILNQKQAGTTLGLEIRILFYCLLISLNIVHRMEIKGNRSEASDLTTEITSLVSHLNY